MHPISFQSVLQTAPTQGSLAWVPMKQPSTYLHGDLGGKGSRLSQSGHPALHPQGHSQNQSAAKPRAATAQMLRLLWTQEDGFYRRPSPRQCRIPMDWGWGPGSLTEYSRNQPGQFAELQGRKEQKEKHLPIMCLRVQRGLLLELPFGIWFKLESPMEERNP